MDTLEVPAQEVRLSARIAEALHARRAVAVTRYGKRMAVLLSEEQFDLVEPLLELLEGEALISPELLKTEEDLELERELAEDTEPSDAESAQIAELLEAGRRQS